MSAIKAKKQKVEELKALLAEHGNFLLTSSSGLGVPAQNKLRTELHSKKGLLKVVKNNLFHLALKGSEPYAAASAHLAEDLKGPNSAAFVGNNFSAVSKALLDFAKKSPKLKVKSACLDGSYLPLHEIKEIASLPSREELLVIIARGLQAPALKTARALQEVIASLARGIQAVAKKNGEKK